MTTKLHNPIYQQLLTTGMAQWVPALMMILRNYEGIERALEPAEQPLHYLVEKLDPLHNSPMRDRERLFFDAVASMPLLYYRVAGDGKYWNPENETFHQFECRVDTISIWQAWTPLLSKTEVNIGSTLIYRFPVMIGLRRKVKPPYSDCLPVLSSHDLIDPRSKQVKTIQQLAGVPKTHWQALYLDALLAFAGYVQQLPASESHHHSGAGGLLDHSLEVVINALRIRRGHLLPQGADADTLTCLCFPASRIWPDPNSRPDLFSGRISPLGNDAEPETNTEPPAIIKTSTPPAELVTTNIETKPSTEAGFDPVAFFSESQAEKKPSESAGEEIQPTPEINRSSAPLEENEDPGKQFRAWIHDGLLKDKFETNSVNARIHRVQEGLLLISPGIFKDFDKDNWQQVQKRFQKLKLHRKTPQGTNIYTYQVTGKRNKSRIKGFLIESPETLFEGVALPSPNPHLALAEAL